MHFKDKKLLILAGASVHVKLVEAAKELGVYTIVTDYLVDSPAKLIADEAWDLNIYDVDSIVKKCIEEGVDGVISCYIDPCQRAYQEICEKLDCYCYGTREQFYKMTDKIAFKKMCIENGVGIIPEYSINDVKSGNVEFPVFVKPVDSRGSRGQSVCNNFEELNKAIRLARTDSSNGQVIIEKYIENAHEFQVTYFYIDGKPYLLRTVDSYTGPKELNLEKVVSCAVSPSKYTSIYVEKAQPNVLKMFEKLGIKNGPVFIQGFYDNDNFYFFDPGLRFPGVDYELIYKKIFNVDFAKKMVNFALCGDCNFGENIVNNGVFLNGNRAAVLFPNVRAGKIKNITGIESLKFDSSVVSVWLRYGKDDVVNWEYNVNQRLAEIDILTESTDELRDKIDYVQNTIKAFDENGNLMNYNMFITSRI